MKGFFRFIRGDGDLPDMTVEINIVAFISNEYINDSFQLSAPEGSSLKRLLKTARQQGKIKKSVYQTIRNLRPPVSLIVNGDNIENPNKERPCFSDGDKITVFTPLSGG